MSRKKQDVDSATAEVVVKQEQVVEAATRAEREERELRLAECNQMIGQIRAGAMFGKFANVSSLVWLQQVKESKLYKEVPGAGTWEEFCNSIGLSRQKVDQDLQNLATFGEEFLLTVSGLSVGYRELRKLRHLSAEGTFAVTDQVVEIDGEQIPLDADHKEDLQAALERVLEQKEKILEEAKATIRVRDRELASQRELIERQERDLGDLEKQAQSKGLALDEDAYLKRIEAIATSFDGYLLRIRALVEVSEVPGTRAASTLLAFLNKARMELNAYYSTAYDAHAPAGMAPEEEWTPGKGMALISKED